jgi:hypothetical protein
VAWQSKLQPTVVTSSTEAEYVAASFASKEALYLRQVMKEVGHEQKEPTIMYMDSQSAIALIRNPLTSPRTKHIDVAHHFVRDCVERGELRFKYLKTGDHPADALTKPLAKEAFGRHRGAMGVHPFHN